MKSYMGRMDNVPSLEDWFRLPQSSESLTFARLIEDPTRPVILESTSGHLFSGMVRRVDNDHFFVALTPQVRSLPELLEVGARLEGYSFDGELVAMLTRLHAAGNALESAQRLSNLFRESEAKHRASLDTARAVIFRCSHGGQIEYANQAWQTMTGYSIAETIGRSFSSFVHLKDSDFVTDLLAALSASGSAQQQGRISILKKNGLLVTVDLSMQSSASSHVYSGMMIDASKELEAIAFIQQSKEIAVKAQETAEAASLAKSEFLASMSHEIRTPLHVLLGMLESLAATPLQESQLLLLAHINHSAQHLLHLVSDVLDLAKIERGAIDLNLAPYNPRHLLSRFTADLQLTCSKEISIEEEIAPGVPEESLGDMNRLAQVLSNLTSNSRRYTASGTIRLSLSIQGDSGSDQNLRFSIQDTGIGIPADDIPLIFNSYKRAGNAGAVAGTGLGLRIVSNILELMGGLIQCTSEIGVGTCFTFTVPHVPVSRHAKDQLSAATLAAPVATLRPDTFILVVEDNPEAQFLASITLSSAKLSFHIVGSGSAAVDAAASYRYDLILMDLSLPDMTGESSTLLIREAESSSGDAHVPIIALTADATAGRRTRCLEAGMQGYLTKPASAASILKAVNDWTNTQSTILLVNLTGDSHGSAVTALLNAARWRVVRATTVTEAARHLTRGNTALAIISIDTPSLDNTEEVASFKARAQGMPIIAVSEIDSPLARLRASSLGCLRLLTGPLGNQDLIHIALDLIQDPLPAHREDAGPRINIPPMLADMAPHYISQRFVDLEKCRAALADANWEVIRTIGHNTKGTGTSYGFPDITLFGQALERAATDGNVGLLTLHLNDYYRTLVEIQNAINH